MKRYSIKEIDILVQVLKDNGVISVPTDTVYGLCAKISSEEAYNNLRKVKNRPENKSFPIMCANEEQIESIAIVNENAKKLIKKFMPGPITIVLKKKANLPKYINKDKETIAVRMATSEELKELITKIETPIFMTSANQSGEPTCITLDEIERKCPKINAILEGDVSFAKASTIVDCSTENVQILREGPIQTNQIIEALKDKTT